MKLQKTAGYIKDSIASILFILSFILVLKLKDLNKLKKLILIILIICFIIDFSFTINPEYHFIEIGHNIPSYLVYGGGILIMLIVITYRKQFKF